MLNEDYRDLLLALSNRKVQFLVVGAYAMSFHGYPRATGYLDLWIRPSDENSRATYQALREFGASITDIVPETFRTEGIVFQIGVPPRRIDLLTRLDGLAFEESYGRRVDLPVDGQILPLLSLKNMIKNKESTGREKDLLDAKILRSRGGIETP